MKLEEYNYRDPNQKILIKKLNQYIDMGMTLVSFEKPEFDWLRSELGLSPGNDSFQYRNAKIKLFK